MEVMKAIEERRSIRKFTGEPVSKEMLDKIFNAGFCAPSAHNLKPYHFILIKEQAAKEKIAEWGRFHKMTPQADYCILICGDTEIQPFKELLHADCGAVIQNMLLCIHDLGLGSVWLGIKNGDNSFVNITQEFELPEKIVPFGMIALGHPAETREAADRFDESKIHYEKW